MKIFCGEKLEVCFWVTYLCCVDLSDFGQTWPAGWSDIDAKKVRGGGEGINLILRLTRSFKCKDILLK